MNNLKDSAAIVGGLLIAVAILGIVLVYNQWAYGDWTCVIKTCVQVGSK